MIMNLIQRFQSQRQLKKNWLEFYAEVNKNLEAYYVMFQLDRLRFFNLDVWQRVKSDLDISMTTDVLRYAEILEDYNQTLKIFKDYESWYSSDIKNKIPDNGRILHAKKNAAQEKFQGLENVIKSAQQSLQRRLADLKIIL